MKKKPESIVAPNSLTPPPIATEGIASIQTEIVASNFSLFKDDVMWTLQVPFVYAEHFFRDARRFLEVRLLTIMQNAPDIFLGNVNEPIVIIVDFLLPSDPRHSLTDDKRTMMFLEGIQRTNVITVFISLLPESNKAEFFDLFGPEHFVVPKEIKVVLLEGQNKKLAYTHLEAGTKSQAARMATKMLSNPIEFFKRFNPSTEPRKEGEVPEYATLLEIRSADGLDLLPVSPPNFEGDVSFKLSTAATEKSSAKLVDGAIPDQNPQPLILLRMVFIQGVGSDSSICCHFNGTYEVIVDKNGKRSYLITIDSTRYACYATSR